MLFNPHTLTFRHSREHAIAAGLLIDVDDTARRLGYEIPVAVTDAVWAILEDVPLGSGETAADRLTALLNRLHRIVLKARCAFPYAFTLEAVPVCLTRRASGQREVLLLRIVFGPGDSPEPVLTILLPSES